MLTPSGLVKIGYTKHSINRRVRDLARMNSVAEYGVPFTVLATWKLGIDEGAYVEHRLRWKLAPHKYGRTFDYFKVDAVMAVLMADEVVASHKMRPPFMPKTRPALRFMMVHHMKTDPGKLWKAYYYWHLYLREDAVLPLLTPAAPDPPSAEG
jgi:hypothetical protein